MAPPEKKPTAAVHLIGMLIHRFKCLRRTPNINGLCLQRVEGLVYVKL